MIAIVGILIGLFVVPDPWTIPVIVGALILEGVETWFSLRISRRFGPPRVGPERIVGQTGRVVEACHPLGRVRVRGELWQARCEAGADLDAVVRIVRREQLILEVEPLDAAGQSIDRWSGTSIGDAARRRTVWAVRTAPKIVRPPSST